MRRQYSVKRIGHMEVYVLRNGLVHVDYSMYFYYILLFVMHVLSLDKLGDLLMYYSLSIISCRSAELLYVYQTAHTSICMQLPD